MKLIFAVLMFVAAVVVTGGLYFFIRKDEQKKSDLEKLQRLPSRIVQHVQQVGNYFSNLFDSRPEATTDRPAADPIPPAA